jgi:CTP synthase
MRGDVGEKHTVYIHVTWLPYIGATRELKTKPTQHSVRELRSIGISPDVIIARADHSMDKELVDKIALFCDVDRRAVVPMKTADYLYEIPLLVERSGLPDFLLERTKMTPRQEPDWAEWEQLVERLRQSKPHVKVALVGKYVELHDAYMSVREALKHAALAAGVEVDISWVHSGDLEKERGWEMVREADGVIVPGGFGERGVEGKVLAARFARTQKVPYLGLCLGMQVQVIEFARFVLEEEGVNSTEFVPNTPHPVIDLMPDQHDVTDLGGTMRLGLYPCELAVGSIAAEAYGQDQVDERHRHRFEFKNAYREPLGKVGMRFSGLSPDKRLVEICEMDREVHPFMVGTQFHPEFLSRPNRPHPLFLAFMKAVRAKASLNGHSEE